MASFTLKQGKEKKTTQVFRETTPSSSVSQHAIQKQTAGSSGGFCLLSPSPPRLGGWGAGNSEQATEAAQLRARDGDADGSLRAEGAEEASRGRAASTLPYSSSLHKPQPLHPEGRQAGKSAGANSSSLKAMKEGSQH